MKVTCIRIKKQFPSTDQILAITSELKRRFNRAGFITDIGYGETRASFKIGLHMRSFKIDVNKHDRNLRFAPSSSPKLTDVPTWDQRVEFNNIVNYVLNKFKVSANVRSGPFTIRRGHAAMNEGDWLDQKPYWITQNEIKGFYVESCDETEFIEARRIERNRNARVKRLMQQNRQWDAAKVRLSVVEGAK